MPSRIHILSQYLWPDDAPTGIYAENVADGLGALGLDVKLVGGSGSYRAGRRPQPRTRITRLPHFRGHRSSLISTAFEYESIRRAFNRYITSQVNGGDVVVVTSAPPTTLSLIDAIAARSAIGVYWLQDFYPQLIRGVIDQPMFVRRRIKAHWARRLGQWTHVVKAAGNLGYHGSNALVIRNWNTLDLGYPRPVRPGMALYTGNLGYAHDLRSFLAMCQGLRDKGVEITVRGDGPGMRKLPPWVRYAPPIVNPDELIRSYWEAEIHLVAGHPALPDAVFPSKFWNAHATGRQVCASGFTGVMADELEQSRRSDFRTHLPQWIKFGSGLAQRS